MKDEMQRPGRINFRSILLVVLIITGFSILGLIQTKKYPLNLSGRARLGKGVAAPNFILPDLKGEMINLADYRCKVVLLNIWATWCPPCVEEMPSMEMLYQAMKDEDFELLAVSIDEIGIEAIIPFMEKHKLNFTVLTDPKGTIKYKYQTTGVPESFIINKKGVIVNKVIGPMNWATPDAIRYFRELVQNKQQ